MGAARASRPASERARDLTLTFVRRSVVVAVGTAAIVTATNRAQGAYFSQSWGWVALAFLVPTSLALILSRSTIPDRLRSAFALLVLILTGWIALSSLWSVSTPGSVREFERMVVFVGVALAIAFVLRPGDGPPVLAGVLVGTSLICAYSLGTRLLPDHLVTHDDPSLENRLGQPLGYPNALGALAALGVVVALGFVSHGRPRSSVAAALSLPVQSATLYFTFSRGSWAALVLSYVVALALDHRWLRTLWTSAFTAAPSLLFLLLASRQGALTSSEIHLRRAAHEGHRVIPALLLLTACSALFAWLTHVVTRHVTVSRMGTRIAGTAVICAVLAGATVAIMAVGGPVQGASRLRDSFDTFHSGGTTDLNGRLFKFYGSGRAEIWPVAWDQFKAAPLAGSGAGSFEYTWYEKRPSTRILRDTHSLYLEALDELGIIGFVLVVGALLVPLIAVVAARRAPFVPFGGAAYFGWAAACAIDWHWEMTGLSITALLAGSLGFIAARGAAQVPLEGLRRAVPLALAVALSVFAAVSLVGNQALFAAREDLSRREWSQARDNAEWARHLLVWSFEPDLAVGDAEAGLGSRQGALRAYRDATAKDPRNWGAWLRLAQVARGEERRKAYATVHELNPLEPDLPGEHRPSG